MAQNPDLYLMAPLIPHTVAALESRFRIHRSDPPPSTRAIACGGTTVIDAASMDRLPNLGIIACCAVGYDGVDTAAAAARGIRVTNTPDVLTDDVADLAIGLILALERRIAFADRLVRGGGWAMPLSRKVSGRRIGIFGLGRIGHAIARRAAPFAGEILYTARSEKADVPYRYCPDITALAAASDILVLAAPGGDATRAIVDANVLAALGADGVLVNVSRGSLVDEPALIAALEAGGIAGAALDVFADEPHVPEALRAMDQVVLTPHLGSATQDTRRAMGELTVANLDAFFAGKPLLTPVP
ncbi:2-hydroxyacid dehydrogenase [Sphingomonas naphthae]|uniref:2-hydroxyacid dehydrogenase n=1 Tax=Sphingomonas naphthae TaxID=1813468 RepID=A0ABY7TGX8_9SPHN|nr:2-hydroxyacid dehydrogenase [Sphingomonas naphthae]WCT72481.1 2-hydroxyacid dehydrogenase [Sphingomonas naphthae]